MRNGFYHYAFTFALFAISRLEDALPLKADRLRGMAIPEKDVVALAAIFARARAGGGGGGAGEDAASKAGQGEGNAANLVRKRK